MEQTLEQRLSDLELHLKNLKSFQEILYDKVMQMKWELNSKQHTEVYFDTLFTPLETLLKEIANQN